VAANQVVPEETKLRELQSRIDDLLAGTPKVAAARRSEEDDRVFAEFLPSDMHRASALSALCMKIADELEGVRGLEAAVNKLYELLGQLPRGMVEHAAKLFLTHYPPARELLQIRSLEERQPGMVQPSGRGSSPFTDIQAGKIFDTEDEYSVIKTS
jgi:hypothetical protein